MAAGDLFGLIVALAVLAYLLYVLLPRREAVTANGITQIVLYLVILTALAYPLGAYMARVYSGTLRVPRWLAAPERGFYRLVGTRAEQEQGWKPYAVTALVFMAVFAVLLYVLLRLQGHLPLNPDGLASVNPWVAMNTTASFVTNTNWQYYGGEYTMSYLSQMAGLAVQNFVSAALGMAVLAAVDPRFRAPVGEHRRQLLGRPLPVARLHPPAACRDPGGCFSISQGVVQTFDGAATATTLEGGAAGDRARPRREPDRDQAARDERWRVLQLELGRPLREPERLHEPASRCSPILLIPVAQVFMFGRMIGSRRQALPGLRRDDGDDGHRHRRCAPRGAARLAGPAGLRREHHRRRRLERRQHVRQGGPLRDRVDRQLGGRDDERLQRLGQRRPRRTHTDGWRRAHHEHVHGGGDLGRRRIRSLRDVLLHRHRRLHRGPHGRTHSRVPREEDRGEGDQARGRRCALRADHRARPDGASPSPPTAGWRPSSIPARTVFRRRSTRTTRRRTTTGARSPATAQRSSRRSSARSRSGSGASRRSIAALALGGSLAAKKTAPPSAGTFRTDGPTFVVLLVGVVILTAGLMIFPALTLGPIVEALQ